MTIPVTVTAAVTIDVGEEEATLTASSSPALTVDAESPVFTVSASAPTLSIETSSDTIDLSANTDMPSVEIGVPGPQGPQGVQGPVGPQGIQGLPGTAENTAYIHYQTSAAAVWTINHPLTFQPNVTVVDSLKTEVWPGDIEYLTGSVIRLTFSAPMGGEAYLS